MDKIELFFSVTCMVYLPFFFLVYGSRIQDLYKVHFDLDKVKTADFVNLLVVFLMPFNVVMFAIHRNELFLMTLAPAILGILSFIIPALIIDRIDKKYCSVPCPEAKAVIIFLICAFVPVFIAFINTSSGEYVINIWYMIGISVGVMLLYLALFLTIPLMEEIRERRLGKTLGGERQKLYRKEELAIKRMPNKKLHELFNRYRSLTEEDYDDYEKYSANENYTYPLIEGRELVSFHLKIICKELNQRRYMDTYWH